MCRLLCVVAVVAAMTCSALAQPGPPDNTPSYDSPEAYRVFDALFRYLGEQNHLHGRELAIAADTMPMDSIPIDVCAHKDISKLPMDAFADMKRQNSHPWRLLPQLPIPRKYELMQEIDYSRVGLEGLVNGKSESPAGSDPDFIGYWQLSAVGFNQAHDRAVVLFMYTCGITCGFGGPVVLTKHDNVWQVDAWPCQIVS